MATLPAITQTWNNKLERAKMEFEHKVGALDDEDLVAAEKEEKNWKGIVISLLVIGSILGAIIVAIALCTPSKFSSSDRVAGNHSCFLN